MTSTVPALGRLLLAAIFIMSGLGKVTDPAGTAAYIASVGLPMPDVAAWGAAAVELIGGLALVLGFQTRFAAFALAVFTVAAAVLFHADFADRGQMINFMKNIAITGGLLQVIAFGAGALSLDARRVR